MTGLSASLAELLAGLTSVDAEQERTVLGITLDSRAVEPGMLFVAVPGTRQDGRRYIADAVARGAVGVVYDSRAYDPGVIPVPAFGIEAAGSHLSMLADRFYRSPSARLKVIGVTGTNGKTTCAQLLAQTLDHTNRCGVIGTLGYGFPGALNTGLHTTPDPVTVQRLLAEFAGAGAGYVSMEVSSHALEQDRVKAVAFAVAVFTNLSRDHLDYHGDMARYAAAKERLFRSKGLTAAVVNYDDEYGRELMERVSGNTRVVTYGLTSGEVRALDLECARDGLRLRAMTPAGEVDIAAPLLGRFNAANLLAVLAVLFVLGFDPQEAARRLSAAHPVPGRVERFKAGHDRPLLVVDYAHTPDALAQVLNALRPHTVGRLWCVFGCGGDRDRGKRPEMGAIAENLADVVILTDDNPRHESGDSIVRDIAAGMRRAPRIVRDRKAAITAALSEAKADDVILIAGKGHEDYQQVGDTRHPYSDRDTVRTLLEAAA